MSFADQGKVTSEAIKARSPQNRGRWISPRTVLSLGIAVIVLHILQEAFLGTGAAGSLIANLLQIFSALPAATTCFVAIRRSSGFTRPFWLLIGLSFLVWTVSDLGWMYYESFRHISPPRNSIFHFLGDCRSLFLANALLLDQSDGREPVVFLRRSIVPRYRTTVYRILPDLSGPGEAVARSFSREP